MSPLPPPSAAMSPGSFPLMGHFSDEEIHELLGAAYGGAHDGHQQSTLQLDGAGTDTTTTAVEHPGPSAEDTSAGGAVDGSAVDTGSERASSAISEEASAEARAQARSERKRSREKQRRSDVNKQFNDLTQLLRKIETEDLEEDSRLSAFGTSSMNRADIIARTIGVLERMRSLNRKRKAEVEEFKKMAEDTAARLKEATAYQQGASKPIMMMMPMMVAPEAAAGGVPMANPFMSQAAFCSMPQLATAAPAAPTNPSATPSPVVPPMTMIPPMMYNAMQQQHLQQQQVALPQQQQMQPQINPNQATAQAALAQPSQPAHGNEKQPSMNSARGNLAHCA